MAWFFSHITALVRPDPSLPEISTTGRLVVVVFVVTKEGKANQEDSAFLFAFGVIVEVGVGLTVRVAVVVAVVELFAVVVVVVAVVVVRGVSITQSTHGA